VFGAILAGAFALFQLTPAYRGQEAEECHDYVPLDAEGLLRDYYAGRTDVTSWRYDEAVLCGSLTPSVAWVRVVEQRGAKIRNVSIECERKGRGWHIARVYTREQG
jgi:hypothetical protein